MDFKLHVISYLIWVSILIGNGLKIEVLIKKLIKNIHKIEYLALKTLLAP